MGYCASGYGRIYPKKNTIPDDVRKELDQMGLFVIGTPAIIDGSELMWCLEYEYDKFRSEDAYEYLDKIAPYIESGAVEMGGEDGCNWKYVFSNGTWAEYNGRVVYDDESATGPYIGGDRKLEFLHDIIDVFEGFLDDKGIVIENPDKEQSGDGAANIYGCDYADLESELECILKKWEVLK